MYFYFVLFYNNVEGCAAEGWGLGCVCAEELKNFCRRWPESESAQRSWKAAQMRRSFLEDCLFRGLSVLRNVCFEDCLSSLLQCFQHHPAQSEGGESSSLTFPLHPGHVLQGQLFSDDTAAVGCV